MKLSEHLFIPFIIQGFAMFSDEFYFHHKRGLPKWERIGHPVDTLSVMLSFFCILYLPATIDNLYIYGGFCLFSCILITKDELVHKQYCSAAENWFHSILFILHPLIFIIAGVIWFNHDSTDNSIGNLIVSSNSNLWLGLQIQIGITFLFLIYQIIYWSVIWKKPVR